MTQHSSQLIGRAKRIIEAKVRLMSAGIPADFNSWGYGHATRFKMICRLANEVCNSGRATLDQLVECHAMLEEFWQ